MGETADVIVLGEGGNQTSVLLRLIVCGRWPIRKGETRWRSVHAVGRGIG